MTRKVFYSFHFKNDCWRAGQVRNIGVIEGNEPVSDNKWEEVKKGGEKAIQKWIDDNLYNRTCTIVLIGSETASRKWIDYEIEKSWNDKKGVLGIYIHGLKDSNQSQGIKGANPFDKFNVKGTTFSSIAKTYNPPYSASTDVYNYIKENIDSWVEEAIRIRNNY